MGKLKLGKLSQKAQKKQKGLDKLIISQKTRRTQILLSTFNSKLSITYNQ